MRKGRLLSVEEMASISGLSKSYFYTNKSLGTLDLSLHKIGRRVLCHEDIFYSWLQSKQQ